MNPTCSETFFLFCLFFQFYWQPLLAWGNSRYNLVKTVLSFWKGEIYSNVMFNGHLLAINKMEEDDFIRARLLDLHEPSQGEEFIKYKHFIKINNSKRNRILVFVDWACKIWRKVEMDKWRSCLLLKLVEILEVFVFFCWLEWDDMASSVKKCIICYSKIINFISMILLIVSSLYPYKLLYYIRLFVNQMLKIIYNFSNYK